MANGRGMAKSKAAPASYETKIAEIAKLPKASDRFLAVSTLRDDLVAEVKLSAEDRTAGYAVHHAYRRALDHLNDVDVVNGQ